MKQSSPKLPLKLLQTALIFFLSALSCFSFADELSVKFSTAEYILMQEADAGKPRQWQQTTLPDLWKLSHPNFYGTAWYKFQFDFNDNPQQIQAVYLTRLSMNGEVFINGKKIGDGGKLTEPVSRNWNRPLLFIIPPLTLKPKNNTLFIKVVAPQYSQGMLHPLEIGRLNRLQQQYNQAMFYRITINQAAGLFTLGIGSLMLSLWWLRKQDIAYGLFGLAAFVWAAQSLNFYIITPPVSTAFWEIFVNSSFEAIAALWLISLLGFSGIKARYFSIWLLCLMVFSFVLRMVAPAPYFMLLNDSIHFLTICSVVVGLSYLAKAWLMHDNKDAKLILATLSVILLFAVHDWMIHTKIKWLNQLLWGSQEYLMQFSAPVLFLIVGLMMTSRYVRAINSFEVLNQELEQRVEAKHQELDQNFQQIQTMLKEQASREERERIYQDLHDDLGAKLLTLVYRAQDSNDAELARAALQDLRDVVSYTDSDKRLFSHAMADFRVECEQRLSDVNIQLDWDNQIVDTPWQLTQPQALNLGRIIRETISNIIRHAQASHVYVRLSNQPRHLVLTISDNGKGLPATPSKQGRGLNNIQKRVAKLHGELTLQNQPQGGLSIQIQLPISNFLTATPPQA